MSSNKKLDSLRYARLRHDARVFRMLARKATDKLDELRASTERDEETEQRLVRARRDYSRCATKADREARSLRVVRKT